MYLFDTNGFYNMCLSPKYFKCEVQNYGGPGSFNCSVCRTNFIISADPKWCECPTDSHYEITAIAPNPLDNTYYCYSCLTDSHSNCPTCYRDNGANLIICTSC